MADRSPKRYKLDPRRHDHDGALKPAEVRRKKLAIVNNLAHIPDDLSRQNSDTLEAAARLIEAIARRCICTLSPDELLVEVATLNAGVQ